MARVHRKSAGLKTSLLLRLLAIGLTAPLLRAAETGDAVVVVYNSSVTASKRVAEHYALRRKVPANQLIGLPLPDAETISRQEYRDKLHVPLRAELERRHLFTFGSVIKRATGDKPGEVFSVTTRATIRYAVLCYGVPLKIAGDGNIVEEGTDKALPELRRNDAAVDSELAFLPRDPKTYILSGPARNPLYAVTNAALLHPTNGVLMVARLDGPTPEIARALVDKALQGETDGLWGRAYFDVRGINEGNYKLGDDWIRGAAQIARRMGFETIVDEKNETFPPGFPMSHIAFYAGWYDADVSGPFAQPRVEFMPGAFAYHLHSYSAPTLRSATRHWVGPLLAKGVTATMGCVEEPYLSGTPDLAIFASRFIERDFSFGEAAYACQGSLSWQTTVVGDPLYRPFGRPSAEQLADLVRRKSPMVAWYHLRMVNFNLAAGLPDTQLIEYLEKEPATRQSAVLQEKLGDFYYAQGKLTDATGAYAKAFQLATSKLQKVRIAPILGRSLSLLGREAEAYELYQRLLEDFPDYPDRLAFYQKLLPLANKLKKTAEAEKYQLEIQRLTPQSPTSPPPKP